MLFRTVSYIHLTFLSLCYTRFCNCTRSSRENELFKSVAEYYFKQHTGDVEIQCLSILLGQTILRIKNIWNIDIEDSHDVWVLLSIVCVIHTSKNKQKD